MKKLITSLALSCVVASGIYAVDVDAKQDQDIAMLKAAVAKLVTKFGELDGKVDILIIKNGEIESALQQYKMQRPTKHNYYEKKQEDVKQKLEVQIQPVETRQEPQVEYVSTVTDNQALHKDEVVATTGERLVINPKTGRLAIALTESQVKALVDNEISLEQLKEDKASNVSHKEEKFDIKAAIVTDGLVLTTPNNNYPEQKYDARRIYEIKGTKYKEKDVFASYISLLKPKEFKILSRPYIQVYDRPIEPIYGSNYLGKLVRNTVVIIDKVTKPGWLHAQGYGWIRGHEITNMSVNDILKEAK
ncbi:hypothetical protein ACHJH3_06285 [Campylobacter sp. MOP7]|uniref:hypothetical protein n=1 Tax=Campylobacter canis TaxID=3378588 RepID=UPI00387E78E1